MKYVHALYYFSMLYLGLLFTEVWASTEANQSVVDVSSSDKDVILDTEVQKICEEWDGKHIAYYSEVFFVNNCQRIELSFREIEDVLKSRKSVSDVEARVIQAIPLKKKQLVKEEPIRDCKLFDKRYVTAHFVYVYYVENCEKTKFPDWDTWAEYQKNHPKISPVIMQLNEREIDSMLNAPEFKSVFDDIQLLNAELELDILPVDEACRDIDGKYVSYYQNLYKIENCSKRKVTAKYLLKNKLQYSPVEMTDQQWMSIPDGIDIDIEEQPKKG